MVLHLLVCNWHIEIKFKECEFDYFVQVPDKGVENTVDIWRVDLREVWRGKGALGTAVTLVHHTLTCCNGGEYYMINMFIRLDISVLHRLAISLGCTSQVE